jgi:hypothetical protein
MPFNFNVYYYFLARERGARPAIAWKWGMQFAKWWAQHPADRPPAPRLENVVV